MFRKYALTGLVAFSIAAAPVAAPSAMAKDNIDRFLIGLAAIGIAGAIAHEANKDKRQHVGTHKPRHVTPHKPRRVHNERHRHGNTIHRHAHGKGHHHGRHIAVTGPQHVKAKPRKCLRQKWTKKGWVKYYSKACLRNHRY